LSQLLVKIGKLDAVLVAARRGSVGCGDCLF
ncbi:MAG: hypothetical protein ACD_42C00098G0001, partial [uncultured bacterium]